MSWPSPDAAASQFWGKLSLGSQACDVTVREGVVDHCRAVDGAADVARLKSTPTCTRLSACSGTRALDWPTGVSNLQACKAGLRRQSCHEQLIARACASFRLLHFRRLRLRHNLSLFPLSLLLSLSDVPPPPNTPSKHTDTTHLDAHECRNNDR